MSKSTGIVANRAGLPATKLFVCIIAVFAFALAGISAPYAMATTSEQTLTFNTVTVSGEFEEGATLSVSSSLYSAEVEEELIERRQIRSAKQIIAIYDISASGEPVNQAKYTVSISDVKLNVLVKNKIAIIDDTGMYYSIKSYDYTHKTLTFQTGTLGQVVVYKDTTLFYTVVGLIAGLIVLVIALKIIDTKRFKRESEGNDNKREIREHDKLYRW